MNRRHLLRCLLGVAVGSIISGSSQARLGGGSTFRSSRSSSSRRSSSRIRFSSRSSGGGGGELSLSGVIVMVVIWAISQVIRNRFNATTKGMRSAPTPVNLAQNTNSLDEQLDVLKAQDPYFSPILLMDFVHSLYHKLHSFQGQPELAQLTPFFAPRVLASLKFPGQRRISEIVVGQLALEGIETGSSHDAITLLIEANYTAHHGEHGQRVRHAVRERWRLQRDQGVQSAEPERMQTLSCPHCGAPAHFTDAGVCNHCGTLVKAGKMQWVVQTRVVLSKQNQGTASLIAYAPEEGTDYPTLLHPRLAFAQHNFANDHSLAWDSFWPQFQEKTVRPTFLNLYRAWSTQQWQQARAWMSDRLYETNAFWIEQYQAQGLKNKLEAIAVQRIELAKLEQDHFYEAITVRIFASCYDYVVNSAGKVLGGSNRKRRSFSEYWTFVRRRGVDKEGDVNAASCPSCGAPVDKMSMSAECGYCGAKVNTGAFGWVLFLITQDEVYRG